MKKLKFGFVGANFTTKHLQNELVKSYTVVVWSHSKPDDPFSNLIDFRQVYTPWSWLRDYLRKIGSQVGLPFYYQGLLRELWNIKPDVLIVLDFYKLWFVQALVYKLFHPEAKLIIHSETKKAPAFIMSKVLFFLMVFLVKIFSKKISHIITFSEAGTEYLKNIFPAININHLVLPIDENTPLYSKNTHGGKIKILMPARFIALKRHMDVIRAAEKISPDKDTEIHFATFSHDASPYRESLVRNLAKSPARHLIKIIDPILPPFSNYYDMLEKYDAIILPSENEGLGAVVPAALRCGKVAIISDMVPASMYMPESHKKYIFAVGDTEKLSRLFNSLQKETLFRDGQIAATHVRTNFSSERIVAKFLSFIKT